MTVTERIARWASSLSYDDVPARVLELARHQVLSVTGAVFAGAAGAGGRAVTDTVERLGEAGPCSVYPGGSRRSLHSALLQNAALSMALDYDDYLFLGHTGHSAVTVPLAVAQARGADARTVLAAQVAANEVAGRLGASVVLGPHNGQMWAHIHLLGAAAAASRVLGLDEQRTADAMGIALSEPVYPLFPGFMGPQSKLLTAAVPAVTGTFAALLAESGMTGPRGILEDREGFWAHFSFLPLPFMMTGLGSAWVTDTIAFKPYPGCAYIDTAVDALLEITARFEHERGRKIVPAEVREVRVEASLLTVAMDSMSGAYLDRSRLSPTNINFSLSISVAIALLAGRLTGAELVEGYLEANRADILELASRVALSHDAALTVEFIRSLDDAIDMRSALACIDVRTLLKARRRLREHLSHVASTGGREAVSAWRSLSARDRSFLRGLVSPRSLLGKAPGYDLGACGFDGASMPFGARVTVLLADGDGMTAERMVPSGGPGDPQRLDVPREKFMRETAAFMDLKSAGAAVRAVLEMGEGPLDRVVDALAVSGERR